MKIRITTVIIGVILAMMGLFQWFALPFLRGHDTAWYPLSSQNFWYSRSARPESPLYGSRFLPITSTDWVRKLLLRYPELSWYANDKVEQSFEQGTTPPSFSWSIQLYGHHYPEFDRAILSLWCLHAFYLGTEEAWSAFVKAQEGKDSLSWESFQQIHREMLALFDTHTPLSGKQLMVAIEMYLVLLDCGKTPQCQELAKNSQITFSHTHTFFAQTLEKCHAIYPSLKTLPFPLLDLIRSTASRPHWVRLCQIECQPKAALTFPIARDHASEQLQADFYYLTNLCDAAASLGQIETDGSLFLTQSNYFAGVKLREAFNQHQQESDGGASAYRRFIAQRAQAMEFDFSSKEDRVLTRLAAMMRLNTIEQAQQLKRAFHKLNLQEQALILTQFDLRDTDPLLLTPIYIPALLHNLLRHREAGTSFESGLERTLHLGAVFVSKILAKKREEASVKHDEFSGFALNFSGVAKEVIADPYLLLPENEDKWTITSTGKVLVSCMKNSEIELPGSTS